MSGCLPFMAYCTAISCQGYSQEGPNSITAYITSISNVTCNETCKKEKKIVVASITTVVFNS